MTEKQITAQAEASPSPATKLSQHARIMETIRKQGFISTWGAIYDIRLHCSKLSTRIGELEEKYGHEFVHEPMRDENNRRIGTRYTLPKGMTFDQFTNKA